MRAGRTSSPATDRPRRPGRARSPAGGRPSREAAAQLQDLILDAATDLFLTQGYGATSIEAIARRARISKRTFYHRFDDKAALFAAVMHRLILGMRPPDDALLFDGAKIEDSLLRLAALILRGALSPGALALYRVIVAEATRFPELALVMSRDGTRREALDRIAALLEREARQGRLRVSDPLFAAEQFLQMVVSVPQRRALGLGTPMTEAELDAWARDAVDLLLNGCRKPPSK